MSFVRHVPLGLHNTHTHTGTERLELPCKEMYLCCFPVSKIGLDPEGENCGNAEKLAEYICSRK